jgi:hypothetical protein
LILLFVFVVGLSFVGTGKRLYILWPLFVLALGIHYYKRPLRTSLLPVAAVAIIALGFLSLMFRVYAPAGLAGAEIELNDVHWAQGSLFRFYFMSLEFASFELLTLAIENPDAILRQFGGAWSAFLVTNIEPLSFFVPRAIWAGKPDLFIDLSHANRVVVLGGVLSQDIGLNSMLMATSWTLAGGIGMAVSMMALGWFAATADSRPGIRGVASPKEIVMYAFTLMLTFHIFRQGTLAWTAMIVVLQQLGLIVGFTILHSIEGRGGARARSKLPTRERWGHRPRSVFSPQNARANSRPLD